MSRSEIFRHILIGLSIVLLFCATKNYLAFLLIGSVWCEYLCPSAFGWPFIEDIPGLKQLFMAQKALSRLPQTAVDQYIADQYNLVTYLITAPIVEEIIYRGPMYLTRNRSDGLIWWLTGLMLVCVFSLSHGRSGIALLPLIALGVCNLWLVARTKYFWPAISLHFLYNFFFVSVILFQSPWVADYLNNI